MAENSIPPIMVIEGNVGDIVEEGFPECEITVAQHESHRNAEEKDNCVVLKGQWARSFHLT
jgi:hypothetical protein